ncbi:hypothetical protein PRIPAC_88548 [Pristionchus pacificus]|uniref:Cytochrome P450 n=1 Tax=Pristionchus pacificus TaxID=54126 RepID=A0A2A6B7K0_PRIPA|nr:hypothetical protein PRIPAC_88548 [Pristionchus pacificus]|eukprot:PDM61833.1 cytochrome P450 [Pristionchus pacificus]
MVKRAAEMLVIALILLFLPLLLILNARSVKNFLELAFRAYEPLKKIPGPKALPLMWLGPFPIVSVVWPQYIKEILESTTLLKKSNNYDIVRKWIGDGLLVSSGEKWQRRRKMLTPAFHFNVLRNYHEVFRRCGAKRQWALVSTPKSEAVWSTFPHLWVPPIWYASGLGFEFDRLVKLTNNFTRNVISERRETLIDEGIITEGEEPHEMTEAEIKQRKPCFLDLLLLMQKPNALSDEDIREEVDTFMFEGHDTTSSSMGFTTWFLGQYPADQAKVQAELDEIFGDSDRQPDEADVKRMVYLERCIKETLRLAPSVPFVGRELQHDVKIAGIDLPENLTLVLSPFGPHRAPEHWEHPNEFYPDYFANHHWDHPNEFYPDHFTTEAMSARHPYAYFPFSAGPRNCIGQKFAMAEEKIVLSWLFRKFRVETVEPYPGNDTVPEIVLKPVYGFKVRLFRRHHE